MGRKEPRKFSHLDSSGNVQMVDVSDKKSTLRFAKASALIRLSNSTIKALISASNSRKNPPDSALLKKGDAFTTAKIAGILAAKRVHELIPLTHPVAITHCDITIETEQHGKKLRRNSAGKNLRLSAQNPRSSASIRLVSTVKTKAETGVEMEALTAVTVAALTIYDMVKSVERQAVIEKIQLEEKWGGKSGHYLRKSY